VDIYYKIREKYRMNDLICLEGQHVYLASISSNDVDIFMESMNDEDVRILARTRRDVMNELNTKEMIERLQREEEGFIVYEKEGNTKIGYALLMDKDLYNREASLALVIGKKVNRGKGFGKEAIQLLMKHGFIGLNLESLFLEVFEYNSAAIKLYEDVGFKYVGKRRNSRIVGNEKYDTIIMDMISEEYFKIYKNNEVESRK
jgi:RimJ/RimL family protein N-acetyltransferase